MKRILMSYAAAALLALVGGCSGSGEASDGGSAEPLRIVTSGQLEIALEATTNLSFEAAGGEPPYRWSLGSASLLPLGMSLSSDGQLSGTALISGVYPLALTAADSRGNEASASVVLAVVGPAGEDSCLHPTPVPLSGSTTLRGQLLDGLPGPATRACGRAPTDAEVLYELDLPDAAEVKVQVSSNWDVVAALLEPGCPATPAPVGCQKSFSATLPAGKHLLALTGPKAADFQVDLVVRPLTGGSCVDPIPLDLSSGKAQVAGAFDLPIYQLPAGCMQGSMRVFTVTLDHPADLVVSDQPGSQTAKVLRTDSCYAGTEGQCVTGWQMWATNLPSGTYFLFLTPSTWSTRPTFSVDLALRPVTLPPANDTCAGATPLQFVNDQATVGGTFRGATAGPAPGGCGTAVTANDVYYSLELPRAAHLSVSGAAGLGLQLLSADCAAPVMESCLSSYPCTDALPPGKYLLRVFSDPKTPPANEAFQFRLGRSEVPPVPANDSCASPEVVPVINGRALIQGSLETANADLSLSCVHPVGPDLVYRIDLPVRSDVMGLWGTRGLTMSFAVGFGTGSCGAADLGCANDSINPGTTLYNVPAGPLWVMVQGLPNQGTSCQFGSFKFELTVSPSPAPPANDTCASAEVVLLPTVGSRAVITGTTAGAFADLGPLPEVVYELRLGAPGRVRIRTASTAYRVDFTLADRCSYLTAIRSSDYELTTDVLPAGSYYLIVAAHESSPGQLTTGPFGLSAELL